MTKCPNCGEDLFKAHGNLYCLNEECKGWFCFHCDKWHPYGYSCHEAEMNWYDVSDQQSYDNWCREHEEDLMRMINDASNMEGMQNEY